MAWNRIAMRGAFKRRDGFDKKKRRLEESSNQWIFRHYDI